MRILLSFEEKYRAYGEAMVGAVRASRPGLEEVALAHLRDLEAELERFDPHLVVSSRPNTLNPGARAAWVLLSDDPDEPSEVCIDGRHRRMENPGLEEMLEIIDETEKLVRTGRKLRGC
jgi:F420-dependent methylenetetrahydromethanopterin dehydrogenase